MLEINEFRLLNLLVNNNKKLSQRVVADTLDISLGKANQLIRDLSEKELIEVGGDNGYSINKRGLNSLEPYKVDNAIIMAAGMSSRFAPLSYEKPKGLLKVKGDILIEREIRQLQQAGINDITVVVGYMKEKFFYLEDKFGVKIVVNEDYYRYNNTSTLICVLDRLKNTYICSSDNYFTQNVFEPYVYRAYYSAVYAAGETDEYCIQSNPRGLINNVTVGGSDSWYMLGHVYFDRKFSKRFSEILTNEYDSELTKSQLWENLYMRHIKELEMYIQKYDAEAVLEFDSLDELREFDKDYINNTDSRIMNNICKVIDCRPSDIVNIKAIKAGMTNTSFSFDVGGHKYVYRHPGVGTENYINRTSEAFSMNVASKLGLDNTFIYMDEKEGWKISHYIESAREMNYHSEEEVNKALTMMKKLHQSGIRSKFDFDIWQKILEFIDRLKKSDKADYEGFKELFDKMTGVYELVSRDKTEKCLCHCDCYSPNFLLDKANNMYLIDWEYSGNDDPASDLGTFICCSDYEMDEALNVIRQYAGERADDKTMGHYTAYVSIASYYWFLWALYQESVGKTVGEYLYIWNKNSKLYADKTFELYGRN